MRLLRWLLLLGLACSWQALHSVRAETNQATVPASGSVRQPDKLDGAVMDGNGILWAFHRDFVNHLYRFDGTEWSEQAAPFLRNPQAKPQRLARMKDGSVACLWQLDEKKMGVSVHTASTARMMAISTDDVPRNDGVLDEPLADSKGRLWITGQFPSIYRVDDQTGWKTLLQITKEQLTNPEQLPDECSRIRVVEAGDGTVWAWSQQQYVRRANLKGVLLIKDDKAELHAEFQTASGQKIDAQNILYIINADARHLWVSVRYDGIYKADISTLKFEKVPDPKDRQLRIVQELHQVGEDLYAVVWVMDHAVLWRLRNGEWKQILPSVESQHPWGCGFAPVPQGVAMHTSREAPWFIPNAGDPLQLTWKYGFPLSGCRSLAYFPNGTLLATGSHGDVFCGPFQLPPKEKTDSRVVEIRSHEAQPWVLDSEGIPWTILNETPDLLNRWTGGKWDSIPIPEQKNALPRRARNILSDAQGRVWVLPPQSSPQSKPLPVQIYDIHAKTWQSFPDLQEAFVKIRPRVRFLANGHYLFGPEYSPDHRRIAFREESRTYRVDKGWRTEGERNFWYYDGRDWKDINVADVIGAKDEHAQLGPPWFDKEGILAVTIRDSNSLATWRMDAEGSWKKGVFESHFPDDIWSEPKVSKRPSVPEGCVTDHPNSIMMDNHGVCWLVWQGILYKALPGKCVRVLGAKDLLPLKAPIHLYKVYVDSDGNAFVYAAASTRVGFIIKTKSAPPRTTLEIESPEGDSVRVRFLASSKEDVEFRWKLDEQDWKTTRQSSLDLKNLANGRHRLQAIATDEELQSDAAPATATFTIQVDPEQQLARFIKQLSDPDYDRRKEALGGLALQPTKAKPALLKARKKADDDLKWWIDATLQEIGPGR